MVHQVWSFALIRHYSSTVNALDTFCSVFASFIIILSNPYQCTVVNLPSMALYNNSHYSYHYSNDSLQPLRHGAKWYVATTTSIDPTICRDAETYAQSVHRVIHSRPQLHNAGGNEKGITRKTFLYTKDINAFLHAPDDTLAQAVFYELVVVYRA